jgi:hypothetical protein
MRVFKKYFFLLILMAGSVMAKAQHDDGGIKLPWGVRDTLIMPVVKYEGEFIPYRELENVNVSKLSPEELAQAMAAYQRLRNAVYVTYPYARTAGATLNDVAAHISSMSHGQRKSYIKTREKELKKEFSDPLENLSVYQGKVLMKLINRQTGNNCYDIIKEYKGGLSARMYQTLAFFFGSSLRQDYDYDHDPTDRQIENIVKEIDGVWYNNPNRPVVAR